MRDAARRPCACVPDGRSSNDPHGVVVHLLAVVTTHADRMQLREPVDLCSGDFENSIDCSRPLLRATPRIRVTILVALVPCVRDRRRRNERRRPRCMHLHQVGPE